MSAALRIVPDPAGDGADVLDEYEMFGHAAGWARARSTPDVGQSCNSLATSAPDPKM